MVFTNRILIYSCTFKISIHSEIAFSNRQTQG